MKTRTKIGLLTFLAAGLYGRAALAQAPEGPTPEGWAPHGPAGDPPPAAPGRIGHRPPPPLIVVALDVNGDGIIDAREMKHAVAALRSLDRNGDGRLTPDEYMGPAPGHRMSGRPPQEAPGYRDGTDESRPGQEARGERLPGGPMGSEAPADVAPGRPGRDRLARHGMEKEGAWDDQDRAPNPRDNDRGNLPPPRLQPGQDRPGKPSARLSPKELLDKFDADGDGKLNAAELSALLQDLSRQGAPPVARSERFTPGLSPEMPPAPAGPQAPGE